ncbi:bifunctional methionine biosynthesis protein MetXA/MetW [Sideroxyarcus emersonii]|uniref:Bifunctional methionine biosynthesis protein MetXA/MetW n=1 Tax=Sideroxyarcus emersonii TaxID=2764705 RepID=A0AAN1X7H1_9PROT|nr:methionine biosynthesis protein MetW [Sideroxyarcus emersonii]BCK86280.1 bifunctional methionine biosynthesis protein MetXA/MetW [Sideroxyarcus emersonii]
MNSSIILSRPDFAAIAAWIPQGSSVLDLGCGDGSLLRYLRETRAVRGYGVEISDANIAACIVNNVNVIQSDLESGIADFEDGSFDFVILSQTLQATHHTEALMNEIVRVGHEGIVSFPNFGYWKNRLQVLRGNMPVSDELPYQWYDTPNVHLCTLNDFEILCAHLQIRILGRHVMADGRDVHVLPSLRGTTAVYRFRRDA